MHERFDESMVVFEWLLLQQGISVNFAYPGRKNKSKTGQQLAEHSLRDIDDALKMNCFLQDFERRFELVTGSRGTRTPPMGYGKGHADFTYLEPSTVPGLRSGFG